MVTSQQRLGAQRFDGVASESRFKFLEANRTLLILPLNGNHCSEDPDEIMISGEATYDLLQMFKAVKPTVTVDLKTGNASKPLETVTIAFTSLKSFEPDALIRNVSLLKSLQKVGNQALLDENITHILAQSRKMEIAWRELDLFYTNVNESEVLQLTILNADLQAFSHLVHSLQEILENVNKRAIDQSSNYSLLVIPGFIGADLIKQLSKIAYQNKVLFLTDFKDEKSVKATVETAKKLNLGGEDTMWTRTVLYTNAAMLREKHPQEKENLYGSSAIAVAAKLYSIDNIAQPIAGVRFGILKGLKGMRFEVKQDDANLLDNVHLNPLTNAFGTIMPFNVATLYKGLDFSLRQYPIIRVLDYVDKVMRHFLNQHVFTTMFDPKARLNAAHSIKQFLVRLLDLKVLKQAEMTQFEMNATEADKFDISLELCPLFGGGIFKYQTSITEEGLFVNEIKA
jgi:hypothetical protein